MVSANPRPGPTPDLKRRVLAAVQAEPAPTQRATRQRAWLIFGICTAIALANNNDDEAQQQRRRRPPLAVTRLPRL